MGSTVLKNVWRFYGFIGSAATNDGLITIILYNINAFTGPKPAISNILDTLTAFFQLLVSIREVGLREEAVDEKERLPLTTTPHPHNSHFDRQGEIFLGKGPVLKWKTISDTGCPFDLNPGKATYLRGRI